MTDPLPSSEREAFLRALEHDPGVDRDRYLEQACQSRPELLAAVRNLLGHHAEDQFLETPAIEVPESVRSKAEAEAPGDRIGNYQLLERVGEGGGGVVFRALQTGPVRREVALKLLRPGMDSKAVIARFEAERQVLALMDHPNIARVYDAGATAGGRPYFVMELVRGERITDFCERHRLSLEKRLELFLQVCAAVAHAHQKGILHRDLKPSNILVAPGETEAAAGELKVIDFGIAKASRRGSLPSPDSTAGQLILGTPAYLSPEQFSDGGMVDTRSDIHGLGVLLFELLVGATPLDAVALAAGGHEALRKALCDRDPPRPSEKLASFPAGKIAAIATARGSKPGALMRALRGDLDWIVARAIGRDPVQRYATVHGFALDVRRHLDGEPVAARPRTFRYVATKFTRRHRAAVASSIIFLAALALGIDLLGKAYLGKRAALERATVAEGHERALRKKVEKANVLEQTLRREAEARGHTARLEAYAADLSLAQEALAHDNLGRARALLERHFPAPGAVDLRGWEWRYLWQFCQSEARSTLCRVPHEVTTLASSADGRWLALGQSDGAFSVWNIAESRESILRSSGYGRPLASFSPTSALVAYADSVPLGPLPPRRTPSSVRLQAMPVASAPVELPLPAPAVSLRFSRDGARLMTVSTDGSVILWNVASGAETHRMQMPASMRARAPMDISDDLGLVACGAEGGRIRVLDPATGDVRLDETTGDESVGVARFSPDGHFLATAGGITDQDIRVWDLTTGGAPTRLAGHGAWISALEFRADCKTLISASADQTIRLWNVRDARQLRVLRGHRLEVWSLSLGVDDQTLASGSKDGTVNFWDLSKPERPPPDLILPETATAWSFANGGSSLVFLESDGTVKRRQGSRLERVSKVPGGPIPHARSLFSDDGRFLAVKAQRGLAVWDLESDGTPRAIESGEDRVVAIAFVGRSLVTWHSVERVFRQWNVDSGKEQARWNAPENAGATGPEYVAGAARGKGMISLGSEGHGWSRDMDSGVVRSYEIPVRGAVPAAWSSDGRRMITLSRRDEVTLWNTETGAKLGEFHGFLLGIHSGAFTPDDRRVALGSNAREAVKLFDTESQQEVLTLPGKGAFFHTLNFSSDGRWLGASNQRGMLHLWRAPSPEDLLPSEPVVP